MELDSKDNLGDAAFAASNTRETPSSRNLRDINDERNYKLLDHFLLRLTAIPVTNDRNISKSKHSLSYSNPQISFVNTKRNMYPMGTNKYNVENIFAT